VGHRNIGNFATPHLQDTEGMTLAADGQLYISDFEYGLGLLRFDPRAMQFTGEAQVPAPSDPYLLAAGPGAPSGFPDVWLTHPFVHRVDRYEIDGMPLGPSRGGSSRRAVQLTSKNSSLARGTADTAVPLLAGPSPADAMVAPHGLTTPLQSLPENADSLSAGATPRQATDAVFTSSHSTQRPGRGSAGQFEVLALDWSPWL
jgi:hypothetical protein